MTLLGTQTCTGRTHTKAHLEIEALLGLLLYLGVKKQNMLSSAEIFDTLEAISLARTCMSNKRFKLLMSALRFDDKSTRTARRTRDVFAPFRDVWDDFQKNLGAYYIPGPLLTIDEQMVPFRGRCIFLQYIQSKPDRYGIKVFWIVDAENGFPLFGIPYLGRPLGQARQVNLGRNIALQLAQPFFKTGRNLTLDNYFTDFFLADKLAHIDWHRSNKLKILTSAFQAEERPPVA